MDTPFYTLKKVLFPMIVLGLSGFLCGQASGQTGNCTVIQQPCNGDGILQTTVTSGMTPPLTFHYNDPYQTIHTVAGFTDTYIGEATPSLYITDGFQNYLWLSTGMLPPFVTDWPVIDHAICPNPGSITLSINSGITPDYVEWYDDSSPFPGDYIGTGNPMSLPGGMYRAKIFYNGCYDYLDTLLWVQNISSVQFTVSTTPANCTNGTASVLNITGGNAPYSILWWNGATSVSVGGLSQGSYSVTVTDNIGCYTEQPFYINQSVQIPVNMVVTNQPTCLQNDGKVMAFGSGGTNPYTYLWNDGQATQEAVNLSGGGIASVVVTDMNGCIGAGGIWLNSSTPIEVTFTSTPSSCTAPTGSATLTITGGTAPYTVQWNTFPSQSGITISNVPPGNYGFTVTDAVGCVQTGTVPIPPQSIINASIYSSNALCPANTGSAGVVCSGASPFSYLWNTGATTQTISGLAPGGYSCQITDANSCAVTKYTQVHSTSPVTVGVNSYPATCMYAANGSLFAVPTGGTLPYSYSWSNGSTSNPATNLTPGNYYVTVTDGAGCSTTKFCVVGNSGTSDACYCRIDGHVYLDTLESCAYTSGMAGIEHIMVKLEPFGYTWTDANGYYSFLVPTGNYTLSEVVQYIYPMTPNCPENDPVSYTINASSGCQYTHDFFNRVNPLHDVHVVPVNWTFPVPGFTFTQKLFIRNDGTVSQPDILLNYYPESSIMPFISAPPLVSGGSYYYNPDGISLNPGAETNYFITYSNPIPVNMPLGTVLNFSGIVACEPPISTWVDDYTPWNNWVNWTATVVGSFDPNSKEVFPKGEGEEGIISVNDSVLDYVIHFQNLGNWYAENVVVTDTLDPDLDWSTVKPGASSHNYTAELSETGVLKFTFPNIHLVWKDLNEINSNGMVSYSVRQKPNLAIGTEIGSPAGVFFDFNPPVITNTTLNTIGIPEGIPGNTPKNRIIVYPDPATTELFIDTKDFGTVSSITVHNLTGAQVLTGTVIPGPVQKVAVGSLSPGMYFISLFNVTGERTTSKFIKN